MTVPPFYDPMLAKVIATAEDRPAALARLDRALGELAVLGIESNVEYLRALVQHPKFQSGETHTGFLPEYFDGWKPARELPEEVLLALSALDKLPAEKTPTARPARSSPWKAADGWRNAG